MQYVKVTMIDARMKVLDVGMHEDHHDHLALMTVLIAIEERHSDLLRIMHPVSHSLTSHDIVIPMISPTPSIHPSIH
jgi:hypothetical protein